MILVAGNLPLHIFVVLCHHNYTTMATATVQDTLNQINSTLRATRKGPYSNYSCKSVSWDDVQRGTVSGGLSCWGANITDTRLYAKDGRQLFTVRGDNWNERLGKVTSSDIALVAAPGHSSSGGSITSILGFGRNRTSSSTLRPFTLREILSRMSEFGAYAGLKEDTLVNDVLDQEVSVRFQTTFLPVEEGEKTTLEFAPELYNYNTHSDEDPRNLIFLCTSQGLAIQQDGQGAKKMYHHAVDSDGTVKQYWLEAESSNHKVGGSQVESKEEKDNAIQRGKATSSVIGVKGMGTRFNVLMTIQVPLEQKKQPTEQLFYNSPNLACAMMTIPQSLVFPDTIKLHAEGSYSAPPSGGWRGTGMLKTIPRFGKSSAARVSRGSGVGATWKGLTVKNPERHKSEHITVTIVMYYTCSGGVPTEEDVISAIDDLEDLYQSVETNGTLSEDKFNFMKSELTVEDTVNIKKKLVAQPPPHPPAPLDFDTFPV